MDAASHDEAVGSSMSLQWTWVRRKTKHDMEERSLQEAGQTVFNAIQNALGDKMNEGRWKRAAKYFGWSVKSLCDLMDVLESDINVEDYRRVLYEAGREKEQELEQPHHEELQEGAG
jgi:hypothetical protein